jgi:F-type H+-transporting ATPase subunit b
MLIANLVLAGFHYIFLYLSPDKKPEDTLLSVEPGLMIWTVIIFILLLFILKKMAWKPLLSSLSNREQMIKESVEKAENLRNEAEKLLEENKKLLEQAEAESRKRIAEGKEYGEKLKNDIIGKANEDTRKMIDQAKNEIERKKLSALNELKDEIASLAIQSAEKIIEENLDASKQKKIIDGFIKQVPKN